MSVCILEGIDPNHYVLVGITPTQTWFAQVIDDITSKDEIMVKDLEGVTCREVTEVIIEYAKSTDYMETVKTVISGDLDPGDIPLGTDD